MKIIFGGIALGLFELGLVGSAWAAPAFTLLHTFTDGSDGGNPFSGLIADSKGNLYGTANVGGLGCAPPGCGVVFELSPPALTGGTWTETVLHSFTDDDGARPIGGLIGDS